MSINYRYKFTTVLFLKIFSIGLFHCAGKCFKFFLFLRGSWGNIRLKNYNLCSDYAEYFWKVAKVDFLKMSTPQEKAQYVSWFIETKSVIQAQRKFINFWMTHFQKDGLDVMTLFQCCQLGGKSAGFGGFCFCLAENFYIWRTANFLAVFCEMLVGLFKPVRIVSLYLPTSELMHSWELLCLWL